jgi:hypothetical protein
VVISVAPNHPWQNHRNPFDVSDADTVTAMDVLFIIDAINSSNGTELPPLPPFDAQRPYLDVNGDDLLTANDALLVINFLNNLPSGEGEAAVRNAHTSATSPVPAATSGELDMADLPSAASAVVSQGTRSRWDAVPNGPLLGNRRSSRVGAAHDQGPPSSDLSDRWPANVSRRNTRWDDIWEDDVQETLDVIATDIDRVWNCRCNPRNQ